MIKKKNNIRPWARDKANERQVDVSDEQNSSNSSVELSELQKTRMVLAKTSQDLAKSLMQIQAISLEVRLTCAIRNLRKN